MRNAKPNKPVERDALQRPLFARLTGDVGCHASARAIMRAFGQWERRVPELSRFFGIIVAMYYNDHAPPHFHAKYGGDQASIRIDNGEILEGSLTPRAIRLVEEWRVLHQSELLDDWQRAQARQPLNRIEPLE
jgi:hypothetical protein